jgi:GTP cyclohydrolase I/GTP cyclohydrolase-4
LTIEIVRAAACRPSWVVTLRNGDSQGDRFAQPIFDQQGPQLLRIAGAERQLARTVLERQEGMRAEVTIAARYPETVRTPVSELPTQEIYTLLGTAVVSERGTRTLTGVEAQGMTACPCAQELVAGHSRERLAPC